jgi:hypothetical protein
MNMKNIIITTAELADLFGIAEKYVSQLVIDHGYPKVGHNAFNMYECSKKRFSHLEEMCVERIKKVREENTKSRLERANAELKELELQEKKGKLISSDQFRDALENEAHIYTKGLDILKSKLNQVLNLDEKQREYIEKEINSIREQIGNIPADKPADTVIIS